MNDKEIAAIRRRFRADRSNISKIRGCYVNEQNEITSEFYESVGLMATEHVEDILSRMKKVLSGTPGKNLLEIEFSNQQVLESPEHALLTSLRKSSVSDDEAVKVLYEKIRSTVMIEGAYLILLASDVYDIPTVTQDDMEIEESTESFSYFVCAICPVKLTKSSLGYHTYENKFCQIRSDWAVSAPEIGFMFPAYENRGANIYKTLYYTHSASESQNDLAAALFASEIPMPATEQKETFRALLSDTIAEDCHIDIVKAVHTELTELIEEHKNTKKEEPLVIDKETVKNVLETCAVPDERIRAFEERFDEEFGEQTEISPLNLVTKQLEVHTANVSIKINAERGDLVQTRIIDGVKYIMIRADDSVEVNGVRIAID